MILKRITPEPYRKWRDWFAWYPVRATNEYGDEFWVWLEPVRFHRIFRFGEYEYLYRFTERNT